MMICFFRDQSQCSGVFGRQLDIFLLWVVKSTVHEIIVTVLGTVELKGLMRNLGHWLMHFWSSVRARSPNFKLVILHV